MRRAKAARGADSGEFGRAAARLVLACAAALAPQARSEAAPAIVVTNYEDGETIRYPLVQLRGKLTDATLANVKSVTVVNTSSRMDTRAMTGPALKGAFKAFAELVPGVNRLRVKAGAHEAPFVLNYEPQTNSHKVRAVHFTDKTGDPTYESQFADDPQDYRARWDAAMKLMQTFTADWMHARGHGRKTFNLELDGDGMVVVHVVRGRRSFDEMQKLGGGAAYGAAAAAIRSQLPRGPYKHLVCVAFSRHIKGTEKATAYAALGGGNVALMGGACFYTWPSGVKDIVRTFSSDVRIDIERYHADDCRRFAVWATASTTVGAGLHELGHAFTLPHTRKHYTGIMLRGGDTLNRYVGFLDPPCRRRDGYREFKEGKEPYWSEVSAAALAPSRWFALDEPRVTEENTIEFYLDVPRRELVVRSAAGLAFLAVEKPGSAEHWDRRASTAALPKELRLPLAEIAALHRTSRLTVRASDGGGHYRHASLASMLNREPNLTTGKAASASLHSGPRYAPAAAVDGELGTYWGADPYPQWFQVDLARAVVLDEIHLHTYADGRRYYRYDIRMSTDGKRWSTVADASANKEKATDEGYRHKFKPVRARYVRVNMLRNSANRGVHVRELRVFGPGDPRSNPAYAKLKELFAVAEKKPGK